MSQQQNRDSLLVLLCYYLGFWLHTEHRQWKEWQTAAKKQSQAFSDNFISPWEKKKKKKKQRQGPAVCIYIYTVLTTMNKTPASQALLGQFKWNRVYTFSSRPYINIVSLNKYMCQWISIITSVFFFSAFLYYVKLLLRKHASSALILSLSTWRIWPKFTFPLCGQGTIFLLKPRVTETTDLAMYFGSWEEEKRSDI